MGVMLALHELTPKPIELPEEKSNFGERCMPRGAFETMSTRDAEVLWTSHGSLREDQIRKTDDAAMPPTSTNSTFSRTSLRNSSRVEATVFRTSLPQRANEFECGLVPGDAPLGGQRLHVGDEVHVAVGIELFVGGVGRRHIHERHTTRAFDALAPSLRRRSPPKPSSDAWWPSSHDGSNASLRPLGTRQPALLRTGVRGKARPRRGCDGALHA